jgi:hypothetical protein
MSRLVATGRTPGHAESEIVSPELVLVDPRLAKYARGLLSGPDDTVGVEQRPSLDAETPLLSERVAIGSSADEEVAEALQRITALSEVEPARKRSLRLSVVSRLRRRRAQLPL